MKYIDAEKLIAKIDKILAKAEKDEKKSFCEIDTNGHLIAVTKTVICVRIKKIINSLQQEAENERIKEQKELNKIAIQYRDNVIAHIEEKRALPSFKGKLLHDFKNEVNTMRQILGVINWGNVQNALFEKFALVFAAWGGYHFYPKETEIEDSFQQEQQEVDVDEVIENYILENFGEPWDGCVPVGCFELDQMAEHFFELGRNARKEE